MLCAWHLLGCSPSSGLDRAHDPVIPTFIEWATERCVVWLVVLSLCPASSLFLNFTGCLGLAFSTCAGICNSTRNHQDMSVTHAYSQLHLTLKVQLHILYNKILQRTCTVWPCTIYECNNSTQGFAIALACINIIIRQWDNWNWNKFDESKCYL